MIRIRWDSDMPREIRDAVGPALVLHLALLPAWMRVLYVQYCVVHPDDGETCTASSACAPEYLHGTITIYASHMNGNDAQRMNDIVHELLHMQLAEMSNAHVAMIDALLPKDGDAPILRKVSMDAQRVAMERTVSSLAHMITDAAIAPTVVPHIHEDG